MTSGAAEASTQVHRFFCSVKRARTHSPLCLCVYVVVHLGGGERDSQTAPRYSEGAGEITGRTIGDRLGLYIRREEGDNLLKKDGRE